MHKVLTTVPGPKEPSTKVICSMSTLDLGLLGQVNARSRGEDGDVPPSGVTDSHRFSVQREPRADVSFCLFMHEPLLAALWVYSYSLLSNWSSGQGNYIL